MEKPKPEQQTLTFSTGATGEACQVSGIYSCVFLGHGEIVIEQGSVFPPCSSGSGHDTIWFLRK